jgi:hypothetical protein
MVNRRSLPDMDPVNLRSRWTPSQQVKAEGPWPPHAAKQPIADQVVRWMYHAAIDMHSDPGLACLLSGWKDAPHPSDLLMWLQFSPKALVLLEKIRTSGKEPVPPAAFQGLHEITKDDYDAIAGIHGIYLHYLLVKLPNGRLEKRVYIGKGSGKITAIDDGPGVQNKIKQIGIVQRWDGGHFPLLYKKRQKDDESSSSIHDEDMLKERPGETVELRKIVVLFGTTALDAITIVHGRNRAATDAVRREFRHRTGNKAAQDYGMDIVTQEKVNALIRFAENAALLLAGVVLKDSPHGFPVGEYPRNRSPWAGTGFKRSRDLYIAMMADLRLTTPCVSGNKQSPVVEKYNARPMSLQDFETRLATWIDFRPVDYGEAWAREKRIYVTLAESATGKEYGYTIDSRLTGDVKVWWQSSKSPSSL